MQIQKRKDRLIQYIQNLSDPRLLERLEIIVSSSSDWADDLTEEEKAGIKRAQEQIRDGQTQTSKNVWEKFDATFG